MSKVPKFKRNNPQTKEEKLIIELIDNLTTELNFFIDNNLYKNTDNEMFVITRDAAIGFCWQTLSRLITYISDDSQKPMFIEDCKEIINSYIEQALDGIKK